MVSKRQRHATGSREVEKLAQPEEEAMNEEPR